MVGVIRTQCACANILLEGWLSLLGDRVICTFGGWVGFVGRGALARSGGCGGPVVDVLLLLELWLENIIKNCGVCVCE